MYDSDNQLSLIVGQRPGTRTGKSIFDACPAFNRDVKFLSLKVGSFLTFQKACLSMTLFEINHASVCFLRTNNIIVNVFYEISLDCF